MPDYIYDRISKLILDTLRKRRSKVMEETMLAIKIQIDCQRTQVVLRSLEKKGILAKEHAFDGDKCLMWTSWRLVK